MGPCALTSDLHRSPGIGLLSRELAKNRPDAILDLGSSSTETVRYLSRFCPSISILDIFQSADTVRGARSAIFRFSDAVVETLPAEREKFDVVLIWDLLHYFERSDLPPFIARLTANCRQDTLVYLIASAIAPIPLTPIRFKIHDHETLVYRVASEARAESPRLWTRDVEKIMSGFHPVRLFQLRNGLQEFLFRYQGAASESEPAEAVEAEVSEVEKPLVLFD